MLKHFKISDTVKNREYYVPVHPGTSSTEALVRFCSDRGIRMDSAVILEHRSGARDYTKISSYLRSK